MNDGEKKGDIQGPNEAASGSQWENCEEFILRDYRRISTKTKI